MANDNNVSDNGKIYLVNPNNFQYQYNDNLFGNPNYNLSVPTEDLSILVELTTTSKIRTVLLQQDGQNTAVNQGNGNVNVSFIKGRNDMSTGGQNFLTTSYTEISTQLEPIEEALGITDINIDFNSSYAPMININFVDVRGGSIFQSGANSIYNVLFRLPYPLFKLKVKGFYGKPVTYCLHLVKCNTKFNSQTGNFEIEAKFVGYTYALLSDMLIGYIKAAGRTTSGKELLSKKGTISINDFMIKMNDIDALIKKQLEDTSDETRNDLRRVEDQLVEIENLRSRLTIFISDVNANANIAGTSTDKYIAILADEDPSTKDAFDLAKARPYIDKFNKDFSDNITSFNENAGALTESKFQYTKYYVSLSVIRNLFFDLTQDYTDIIKTQYDGNIDISDNDKLKAVRDRLINASPDGIKGNTDDAIGFIDVSWTNEELDRIKGVLEQAESDLQEKLAQKLSETITSELTFQPNIRNVVKMFTAHIEVFLQLLFNVSAKYQDTNRLAQLSKFKLTKNEARLDVKRDDLDLNVIYPWPEYIENDEERYLGSIGVLEKPLDVPEIQFVEELYEAMVKNVKELQTQTPNNGGPAAWPSIVPAESIYHIDKKAYDRLPDSANQDDLAVYVLLRAMAFMGFNLYLTNEEIQAFAQSESEAIIQKFGGTLVLTAFNKKYPDLASFQNLEMNLFVGNDIKAKVIEQYGSNQWILKGGFVDETRTNGEGIPYEYNVVPFDRGFNYVSYANSYEDSNLSDIRVTTRPGGAKTIWQNRLYETNWDNSKYIEILNDGEYQNKSASPPQSYSQGALNYGALATLNSATLASTNNTVPVSVDSVSQIGFKICNGKYGSQEFSQIAGLSANQTLPYYALFYTDVSPELFRPNFIENDSVTVRLYSPLASGLSQGRIKQGTFLDLIEDNNQQLPFFTFPSDISGYPIKDENKRGFFNLFAVELPSSHTKINENINAFTFSEQQNSLIFPFFNFEVILYNDYKYSSSDYGNEPEYAFNAWSQSLFGSRLYYGQTTKEAKAFLFLHCFPFNGLVNNTNGIFNKLSIYNTFALRTGFVQVPYLWPAFIGGLLWRYYSENDPIRWYSETDKGANNKTVYDFFIPGYTDNTYLEDDKNYLLPQKNQYLRLANNPDLEQHLKSGTATTNAESGYDGLQYSHNRNPTGPMSFVYPYSHETNYLKLEDKHTYLYLEEELTALPYPVQLKFIDEFKRFVNEDWGVISPNLELDFDDLASFEATWNLYFNATTRVQKGQTSAPAQSGPYTVYSTNTFNPRNTTWKRTDTLKPEWVLTAETLYKYIKTKNGTELNKRYIIFTTFPQEIYIDLKDHSYDNYTPYNYFLENRQNGDSDKILKEYFFKYKWIENNVSYGFDSFGKFGTKTGNLSYLLNVSNENLSTYITALNEPIKAKVEEDTKVIISNKENDTIKLEIYRTCKKIYDKWIGGIGGSGPVTSYNDILFQCCTVNPNTNQPDRLSTDQELKNARGDNDGEDTAIKLIDSFRFVSRSFRDIGSDFQLNPISVNKLLYESSDISFYDLLSRILSENNFDFVSLPNFIDYNKTDEMKDIFKPYPWYEAVNVTQTGPSFVCVYVGQTSTKLDFKSDDGGYPNDGFDIREDFTNLPADFNDPRQSYEDPVCAFLVSYGHQNQNFFKDIRLDQAEFNETAESLKITDAISNRLNTASSSYIGQNLYNVYSVRSYKVEVEMLGDAMIQPMMYFQLDNIPMFHGAYLITKVRHSIKPNNMFTTFTGTRVRVALTPLIDINTLYSSLLDGAVLSAAPKGGIKSGSYPPIVATIVSNGATNGYLAESFGNIKLVKVPEMDFVYNEKNIPGTDTTDTNDIKQYADRMIDVAVPALTAMMQAFIDYAKTVPNEIKPISYNGKDCYLVIASLYRNYEKQKTLTGPGAATPGTSNHSWGIAVDIRMIDSENNTFFNLSTQPNNVARGFDININKSLKWFWENAHRYGFYHPYTMRNEDARFEEFWHFEYHGKSAVCLWNKHSLKAYKYNIPAPTENYDASVANPKNPDGTDAVYNGCDYIQIRSTADGVDGTYDTKNISAKFKANEKIVLDYFKAYGLTREQTAGIMGNIFAESTFDTDPQPFYDTNGKYSYGLIQWNSGSYDISVIKGKDALFQSKKITDGYTAYWNDFISESNSTANLDADYAAYLFAKNVERCACCTKNKNIYNSGCSVKGKTYNPSKRSLFANDYYLRFNDSNDPLYWGSTITIPPPNAPTSTNLESIIIGDSLSPNISSRLAQIGAKPRIISPSQGVQTLWQGGKTLEWLVNALKQYPTTDTIKYVVITIGTNGAFNPKDNKSGLMGELKRAFPSAQYIFVKGSWGWLGVKNVTENQVNTYYDYFAQNGATVIPTAIGYAATDKIAHSTNLTSYDLIAPAIKAITG